jgi:hypothetical protein
VPPLVIATLNPQIITISKFQNTGFFNKTKHTYSKYKSSYFPTNIKIAYGFSVGGSQGFWGGIQVGICGVSLRPMVSMGVAWG